MSLSVLGDVPKVVIEQSAQRPIDSVSALAIEAAPQVNLVAQFKSIFGLDALLKEGPGKTVDLRTDWESDDQLGVVQLLLHRENMYRSGTKLAPLNLILCEGDIVTLQRKQYAALCTVALMISQKLISEEMADSINFGVDDERITDMPKMKAFRVMADHAENIVNENPVALEYVRKRSSSLVNSTMQNLQNNLVQSFESTPGFQHVLLSLAPVDGICDFYNSPVGKEIAYATTFASYGSYNLIKTRFRKIEEEIARFGTIQNYAKESPDFKDRARPADQLRQQFLEQYQIKFASPAYKENKEFEWVAAREVLREFFPEIWESKEDFYAKLEVTTIQQFPHQFNFEGFLGTKMPERDQQGNLKIDPKTQDIIWREKTEMNRYSAVRQPAMFRALQAPRHDEPDTRSPLQKLLQRNMYAWNQGTIEETTTNLTALKGCEALFTGMIKRLENKDPYFYEGQSPIKQAEALFKANEPQMKHLKAADINKARDRYLRLTDILLSDGMQFVGADHTFIAILQDPTRILNPDCLELKLFDQVRDKGMVNTTFRPPLPDHNLMYAVESQITPLFDKMGINKEEVDRVTGHILSGL